LLSNQINACIARLSRMQNYIQTCEVDEIKFSPSILVLAVDRFAEIYNNALSTSEKLNRAILRILELHGVYHVSGRITPNEANTPIAEEAYSSFSTETSSTPIPPPTPPLSAALFPVSLNVSVDNLSPTDSSYESRREERLPE
jgi:hypothetical protein